MDTLNHAPHSHPIGHDGIDIEPLAQHAAAATSTEEPSRAYADLPGQKEVYSSNNAVIDTRLSDTIAPVRPATHEDSDQSHTPNTDATAPPALQAGPSEALQTGSVTTPVVQESQVSSEGTSLNPNDHSTSQSTANISPDQDANQAGTEQEWPLKSIYWPPFAPHPSEVKILMQDLNGPCSFLALCNVLLLRGNIAIPPSQTTATFSQLSGLVADYLLRCPTPEAIADGAPPLPSNALDFALNIMPKTLSGLDVNVNFLTGQFSRPSDTPPGELELFKLADVHFRHGWLASSDDSESYEVIATVAQDYDTAVNVLVEGDAIAEGAITGYSGASAGRNTRSPTSPTDTRRLEELFEQLDMEPNKQAKVYQATIIKRFLDSTGSQLTYAGLFKLSESLQPGSLCALFRNSHFTVLYRRPDALPDHPQVKLPQATLFHLVTDQALLHEGHAVWESLEDVDGAASRFFDSRLQPARIRQDWVSREARDPAQVESQNSRHDADLALAAQMQQEEYDAEEVRRHRERGRQAPHSVPDCSNAGTSGPTAVMPAPNESVNPPGSGTKDETKSSKKTKDKHKKESSIGKKDKKDCIIS